MGHHFNLDTAIIIPPSPTSYPHYELIFVNNDSGEQVRMHIPRFGMFEDPTREITPAQVEDIAEHIAGFLHDFSGDPLNPTP